MARPEGNPIEGLGQNYRRTEAFQQLVGGFETMQRRDMPQAAFEMQAQEVFTGISATVEQPYVPIYWLARAFPSLIPTAIPFIAHGARSEGDIPDAQKKLDKLAEIDFERKNPIEFGPSEDDILTVTPRVERSIYNAIKYNDQGRPLLLMPMEDLPGIPGRLAVTIEQDGDKWGIGLHLRSTDVDIQVARDDANDFRNYTSIFHGRKDISLVLQDLEDELFTAQLKDMAVGTIGFGKFPGGKPPQARSIQQAFDSLAVSLPTVLDEPREIKPYSERKIVIEGQDGSSYGLSVANYETVSNGTMKTEIDGLRLERFGTTGMPRLTDDYDQFHEDLQRELRFASGVLSWLYQYSRADINYQINLQSPDFGLLDWMEGNQVIEKVTSSPNKFTDLGGNYDLRLAIEEDADNFVHSYRGEKGALKPQNTLIFGETGIGKTALENGIAAKLVEEDIPVFVLKGDLFAQTMLDDPQEGVRNLKQMFFYLLMHGGAVMVRDFDALLGSRDKPEVNTLVEGVLLSELQRIKEDPSTWFVADTQFIGRISEALLNAHRIGKHREVPIETDPQGIEHIITAVVRRIDREIHRRTTPLGFADIQTTYPFNVQELAAKIADFGGMIPAQIERMVREEMQAHATEGYTLETDSLLDRVDVYAEERTRMMELRELQRAETLQATASEALGLAQAAIRRVQELEAQVTEMREGMGTKITHVRRDVEDLRGEVGGLDLRYSLRLDNIENQLTDLEAQVRGGTVFSPKDRQTVDENPQEK